MGSVKAFSRIVTDDTLRETAAHGSESFPFQYYLEDVFAFDLHRIDWHWHPEVEFFIVRSGICRCRIGSEQVELCEGMGMFINSRVLHRFEAENSAVIPNVVFSPVLLASEETLIYRKFILPILERTVPFQILSPENSWQSECLKLLTTLFRIQENGTADELHTLRLLLEIWTLLWEQMPTAESGSVEKVNSDQMRLQLMMQYIQEHFMEPVTLDEIAASVFLSRNRALQIFSKEIGTSPVAYLIEYRLRAAARLLSSTEKSVAAIADETGFSSSGYFCRKFKELYRMSPNVYRQWKMQSGRRINTGLPVTNSETDAFSN